MPPMAPPAFRIDSHAHIFFLDRGMAPGRRYTPPASAPLAAYLERLDDHGLTHGVLVQPSSLGTDNGTLVNSLQAADGRLRGIAVVDPSIDEATLAGLAAAGVVGIRLNLLGRAPETVDWPSWQDLCRRAAARGWQVEVHAEGWQLAAVLERLADCGAPLVVDHFGRPDPQLGTADPGFRAILALAPAGGVWVKLSGPYRCGGADVRPYAAALLDALGPCRLLWGSDWPWTQYEAGQDYGRCLAWLNVWMPDAAARQTILGASAARLFGFA